MENRLHCFPWRSRGGLTINEALRNRRSWREYNAGTLSLEELSGGAVGRRG